MPISSEKLVELEGVPSVLLADDDPVSRKVGQVVLTKLGAHVRTVKDGQSALDALLQDQIDIAILDLKMPSMNGDIVIQEFRRTRSDHEPKFVLLTAYSATVTSKISEKLGVRVLSKPVDTHQFSEILRGNLRNGSR